MLNYIINIISSMGVTGLYLVILIEGLSIPFPGTPLLLTYGYLLNLNLLDNLKIALFMSVIYVLASYVPFGIGYKLGDNVEKYFQKKLIKARKWFKKYGEVSIALSRPLGFGNYISFISGISKIRFWKYGLLSFIGIYPWFFTILYLGHSFNGKTKVILELFQNYQRYLYIGLFTLTIIYLSKQLHHYLREKRKNT